MMPLGEMNDDRSHVEIMALQQLVCADIAFYKNQQWQAAYYGLLLYAALVAIPAIFNESRSHCGYIVLWFVSFLVLVMGIYVLTELESALSRRRDLLVFARRQFTELALKAYGHGDSNAALTPANEKASLKNIFSIVYIAGFLINSWLLVLGWVKY